MFPFRPSSHLSRTKIDSIVRRNDSVADEDAPTDPESVRFWCTTGGWYQEKEKAEIKASSKAAVASTASGVGSLVGLSGLGGSAGVSSAVAAPATPAGAPSLSSLVAVMADNPGGTTPGAKVKCKAKAKPKVKALPQHPMTEKEKRDAARTLVCKGLGCLLTHLCSTYRYLFHNL